MREILFRGQDAITREWIYGCYVDNRDRGRCPPIIVPKNGNPHIYVFPETVGQFTGLLDKNGKKIFEGDIVKINNSLHVSFVVSFQDGCFCFGVFNGKSFGDFVSVRESMSQSRRYFEEEMVVEVIGNINDNPELLP